MCFSCFDSTGQFTFRFEHSYLVLVRYKIYTSTVSQRVCEVRSDVELKSPRVEVCVWHLLTSVSGFSLVCSFLPIAAV